MFFTFIKCFYYYIFVLYVHYISVFIVTEQMNNILFFIYLFAYF